MTRRCASSDSGSASISCCASGSAAALSPAASSVSMRSSSWRRAAARWAARRRCSQASRSGFSGRVSSPNSAELSSRSCATPAANPSDVPPCTASRPSCLRSRNSRWRSALRAASAWLPGHNSVARRSRAVAPSSASQASNSASGVASSCVWSCSRALGAPRSCSSIRRSGWGTAGALMDRGRALRPAAAANRRRVRRTRPLPARRWSASRPPARRAGRTSCAATGTPAAGRPRRSPAARIRRRG